MELREHLQFLRRRWLIVATTAILALIVGAWFTFNGPRSYETTIRLAVSVTADPRSDQAPYRYFSEYYGWLASEYLADDISEVIKSDLFAGDVGAYLNEPVARAQFRQAIRTRKTHRIVEVTVQAPTREQAQRIGGAVGTVLKANGPKYLAQLASPSGQIVVLDEPAAGPATTTGSQLLDILLRGAAGLLGGLFLAYLVDYLDVRFRSRWEVERILGLPVLAEIPGR